MLKVVTLFSGIGAPEKALKNIGVPYELLAFCENNPESINAFCAIHNVDKSKNLGDITKVESIPPCDLLIMGSPCTNISTAGSLEGMAEGSGTESSLIWEATRLIKQTPPRIVILENVCNLAKQFKYEFDKYLNILSGLGYKSNWEILSAINYGLPQNRKRLYCISRLDGDFTFPQPIPLTTRLKDYLRTPGITRQTVFQKKVHLVLYPCVGKGKGRVEDDKNIKYFLDKVKDKEKICELLEKGAYFVTVMPKINPDKVNVLGYYTPSCHESSRIIHPYGLVPVIKDNHAGVFCIWREDGNIARLSPHECWLLMGFDDEDFARANSVIKSKGCLYKLAGNSICVPVLEAIFKKMW